MIIQDLDYYLDPLLVISRLPDQKHLVFLDSSDQRHKHGNYSILAIEPFLTFSFQNGKICLSCFKQGEDDFSHHLDQMVHPDGKVNDPLAILQGWLTRYRFPKTSEVPFPTGGLIGYFSYDLGAFLEGGVSYLPGFEDWPEMEFGFYDTLLIFDHRRRVMTLVSTGLPAGEEKQDRRAHQRFSHFLSLLKTIKVSVNYGGQGGSECSGTMPSRNCSSDLFRPIISLENIDICSNFNATTYPQAVLTIKDYIARGDVYQVNLSQQFFGEIKESGYDLYQRIRRVNRVPYGGYLRFEQREILCFSMERFLRMDGRQVQTRPIKGTRPRGKNIRDDRIKFHELLHSEKDKAELLMVIDMERNDLGKVCEFNSVWVDQLFEVEEYATVFHLVSTISGRLRPDFDHLDCLRACFPGGSITGTPKIRAMEIIAEIERIRRGVYCGAIGYFGFNEVSDFNIPIRTILMQDSQIWFNAGGGVVADSDPHLEYLETLHKVQSFLNCLKGKIN